MCIKNKIKIQSILSKRLKTDLRSYEALKFKVPVNIYMNIYLHCKNKTIKTNQSHAIIHNIHIRLHGTTKHFSSQACTIRAKLNTALQKQRNIYNAFKFRISWWYVWQNKCMIALSWCFYIGQNNNISMVRRSIHVSFLSNRLSIK